MLSYSCAILLNSTAMENLPVKFPVFEPGSVWLVGAGPGDPGLMSLAGLHALQTTDVIVYDALVGDDILKLARPEALQEFAGKRGGKPSPKQTDITERLVELARDGKRVLRLKGGDPFVFGRGAEGMLPAHRGAYPVPRRTRHYRRRGRPCLRRYPDDNTRHQYGHHLYHRS